MVLKKPKYCFESGCPLASKGFGFAPAVGPENAEIAIIGEALGKDESIWGKPFIGAAGGILDKALRFAGIPREKILIHNTANCYPPNMWIDGAPWEDDAIRCCSYYLEDTLNKPKLKVVVPVGGVAIRRLLGIGKKEWKSYKKPMENFHGTVHEDPYKRFWVVPTFHPSFIQRGNHNLTGVLIHDLLLAKKIAAEGYTNEKPTLRIDPPIEWFMEWVRLVIDKSREFVGAGEDLPWLAVDIETPEKEKKGDESETELDDPSFIITRVNFGFSVDPDFGLTVPWSGPYISETAKLLRTQTLRIVLWHQNYDAPRLERNGSPITAPLYDMMDGFHMIQPGLPKGLGFVSPFFSKYKTAWKHLANDQPGTYAAMDGVQTVQCALGIEKDLKFAGQWEAFERHGRLVDKYALKPAEKIGLKVETSKEAKNNIYKFQELLERYKRNLLRRILAVVPEELIPLEPKGGYKRRPLLENGLPKPEYFERVEMLECYKCLACSKVGVTTKHRCKERKIFEENHKRKPFKFGEFGVSRWYKKGEFNPGSPPQVLSYIKYMGHKPGMAKKTHRESSDVDTIERLNKKHGGDFYKYLLKLRKIDKVKGTYVDGVIKRLDIGDRIRSVFTNAPDTWRTSARVFNSQNVISAGKREDLGLGEKFRSNIIADNGCYLWESDFSGIEAVQVGWFSNDPQYIRLSKLSTHAFAASHMKEFEDKPADISWSDEELGEYLTWIKHNKKYKRLYNRAKRVTHQGNYGATPKGLRLTYPEDFPTIKAAEEMQDVIFDLFPAVRSWQSSTRKRAHEQRYLGGTEHPFRYRLYFWNVYNFKKVKKAERDVREKRGDYCIEIDGKYFAVYPGEDYKACIAYMPQSTAAGILRETMLRLFNPESSYHIGNVFYGKTPLRSPIHDSLLLEVPKAKVDFVLEKVHAAMTHPVIQQPCPDEWGIGEYLTEEQLDELEKLDLLNAPREVMERTKYLTIGVEHEMGKNWGEMEEVKL